MRTGNWRPAAFFADLEASRITGKEVVCGLPRCRPRSLTNGCDQLIWGMAGAQTGLAWRSINGRNRAARRR